MILVNGKVLNSMETDHEIRKMKNRIAQTLDRPLLSPAIVMKACNTLAEMILSGEYDSILNDIMREQNYTTEQISVVINNFKSDSLLNKIEVELGGEFPVESKREPIYCNKTVKKQILPLGVLFHVAAGNLEGLPVYSVVEGLLVGNINILKLPAADHGLTIKLLSKLVEIEPLLAEYIYVFDTSSNDLETLIKLSELSDAVIVWGGNEAVKAARRYVSAGKKIIEWGHKISFAYVTKEGIDEKSLKELAEHIFETNQLLCSSCQGIYIDTVNMQEVYSFSEKFIGIMEERAKKYPKQNIGITAQLTLMLYNQELESISTNKKVYKANGCSIIASYDDELTTSFMFGNCWVKPLPRNEVVKKLYPYRGYLQTVGLLCNSDEREELSNLFARAGVVRIKEAGNMSHMDYGEAHDGEYPLRRYSRVVEYDV
jgi:hypothetical protein